MNNLDLQKLISDCHAAGKKAVVSFCSHVPQEILLAADVCSLRIPYVREVKDAASHILPRNVCPIVRNCCNICEDECLKEADLIIAETSCDGKRKMYELISRQERVYFYQVPQGADRDYVKPLIQSECRYLVRELKRRFDADITEEKIRLAGELLGRERESITKLMEIQRQVPPAAWGQEIFQALEEHRSLPDVEARIVANEETRKLLLSRQSTVPKKAKRILVTGCPLSGLYKKILESVEQNGGVVVCFENCEVMKSASRRFDTENPDVYEALSDCYANTACAIMSQNNLRFELIRRLTADYQVDGVLDVTLQVCHPYTVERDKMSRLCEDSLGIPYMAVITDDSGEDIGQLTTRIAAFIEML
ncbi:2-hydroxyacyl-CoA dehydratase family protein [Roseburia hominis]